MRSVRRSERSDEPTPEANRTPPPDWVPASSPRYGYRGEEEHNPDVDRLPSTDDTRARMSRQRSRDTSAEMSLRRELYRVGLRYRVHRRPLPNVRREADVVFGPAKVAVFVDGCFWHGCPEHATWPKRNSDFWRTKIEKNRARDSETDQLLTEAGWLSLRVWEHEDALSAADRVRAAVATRRPVGRPMQNLVRGVD